MTTTTTPKPTEAHIVDRIRKALVAKGCYVVKHHGGAFGVAGTPDLLICAPGGRFVALEVKRPDARSRVTRAQVQRLRAVINAGGFAGVVTSVEEALSMVFPIKIETVMGAPVTFREKDEEHAV